MSSKYSLHHASIANNLPKPYSVLFFLFLFRKIDSIIFPDCEEEHTRHDTQSDHALPGEFCEGQSTE
jgi:hypothetical protein